MPAITRISLAAGIETNFNDGTRYLLRTAQFPSSTSDADLEAKLQALLDQFVNPKLNAPERVVVHVYSRSPIRIGVTLVGNGQPYPNWWVEHPVVDEGG